MVLNLYDLSASFTGFVTWIVRPRQCSSVLLTESHVRSILVPFMSYRASICRNTTIINLFVAMDFNLLLFTQRFRYVPAVRLKSILHLAGARNSAIFPVRAIDPLFFTRTTIHNATTCSYFDMLKRKRRPLNEERKLSCSTGTCALLSL